MPIIKSAKKRVKLAAKAHTRNTRTRRDMREAIKAFNKALESGKSAHILKLQAEAASAIDTATKKNVIHKNKAARFKSKLSQQAKVMVRLSSPSSKSVKPTKVAKKSATKTRAKTVKKAPAKKPAAKKK